VGEIDPASTFFPILRWRKSAGVACEQRERFNRCGLASEIPFSFTALMNSVDLHDRDDVLFKRSIKYNDVLHSFECWLIKRANRGSYPLPANSRNPVINHHVPWARIANTPFPFQVVADESPKDDRNHPHLAVNTWNVLYTHSIHTHDANLNFCMVMPSASFSEGISFFCSTLLNSFRFWHF
jgi:hypothetical protein